MKTIEQLELDNIVLIDKYLNDELPLEDQWHFENRLKIDNELRIDFKMVVESYRNDYKKVKQLKKRNINLDELEFDKVHISRKAEVAKKLINLGLIGVVMASILLIICAIMIAFFL